MVDGVVPPGVVTETLTVPAACAGALARSWVDDRTVMTWAVVVPNLTLVTVENPVPVMVTVLPPPTGPVRDREVMVGMGS